MKTFKQFLENQNPVNYSQLGFPPWARTTAGQYFLTTDGKIQFVAQGKRGVMNYDLFKPIYDKYFAKDITPQMAQDLTYKYAKYMTSIVDDAPQSGAKTPEFYQDDKTIFSSYDGDVIHKSPTAKIISSQSEFEQSPHYQELMDKIYNLHSTK